MPGLGDDERCPRAHDPDRLAQDHLELARIVVGGELAGAVGRLDVVEPHDPPLGLGESLVRDDDHVAVLELGPIRDQRPEIVALGDLREPLDREDPELRHLRARSRRARSPPPRRASRFA